MLESSEMLTYETMRVADSCRALTIEVSGASAAAVAAVEKAGGSVKTTAKAEAAPEA